MYIICKIRSLIVECLKMSNSSSVDLGSMRKPYRIDEDILREDSLPSNPLTLFHEWFEAVKKCPQIYEPNAVCIATSDNNGRPSARMVLLKGYGEEGFKIFTNTESRKGRELKANPSAALLFYWDVLHRQVRIEGRVEQLTDEEANEYFASRPRGSQLSARVSHQSQPIDSYDTLQRMYSSADSEWPNEVPKPDYWGGYKIVAERYEFWQGHSNRLHDRIVFTKRDADRHVHNEFVTPVDEHWFRQRLQP